MLEVEAYETRVVIETKVHLRVAQVAENVFVFRRSGSSRTIERSGKGIVAPLALRMGSKAKATTLGGFMDANNLAKLKQGKDAQRLHMAVVDPRLLEQMRKDGWTHTGSDYAESLTAPDPFKALVEDGVPLDRVIRYALESHMIFDLEDRPHPLAIDFDYLMGGVRMDESVYDLKKAAAILLARKDILIRKTDWRGRANHDDYATDINEAISPIPHYNAERGRTQTITFRWIPTTEDYRRMWAQCQSYERAHSSGNFGRAIFDLDLFGLRAGGAALFEDYWMARERSLDNDEG